MITALETMSNMYYHLSALKKTQTTTRDPLFRTEKDQVSLSFLSYHFLPEADEESLVCTVRKRIRAFWKSIYVLFPEVHMLCSIKIKAIPLGPLIRAQGLGVPQGNLHAGVGKSFWRSAKTAFSSEIPIRDAEMSLFFWCFTTLRFLRLYIWCLCVKTFADRYNLASSRK